MPRVESLLELKMLETDEKRNLPATVLRINICEI